MDVTLTDTLGIDPLSALWFDHPEAQRLELVGGKAASLARLAVDQRVPPGFTLSTKSYEIWGATTIGTGNIAPEFVNAVEELYAELEIRTGVMAVPVAVRSSAVDEDGTGDSFAGLHDTFLNIVGADAVMGAVVKCWASLNSPQALQYRKSKRLDVEAARMGVVVQQLVPADASAVAFSANPISGDRNEILINANYGLGESVVSGMATPDTIILQKSDLSQQSLTIGPKEYMSIRTDHGTEEKPVPRSMQAMPALSPAQVTEIAQLAVELEQRNGWPVDIECAFHNGLLYLLQCRPITTL